MSEQDYMNGGRNAWTRMMQECLRNLGYTGSSRECEKLILEREQAISMLRQICNEHGDNDWPDNLNLSDIIEKHLWSHLEIKK